MFLCNLCAHYTGITNIVFHIMFGCICVNAKLLPEETSPFLATFSELSIVIIMFALGKLKPLHSVAMRKGPLTFGRGSFESPTVRPLIVDRVLVGKKWSKGLNPLRVLSPSLPFRQVWKRRLVISWSGSRKRGGLL